MSPEDPKEKGPPDSTGHVVIVELVGEERLEGGFEDMEEDLGAIKHI